MRGLARRPLAVGLIFVLSLVVTTISWFVAHDAAQQCMAGRFDYDIKEIHLVIAEHMDQQEVVLRGGVGLFAALGTVDRREWCSYFLKLGLEEHFPGLLGYGFSAVVQPQDLDDHIRGVQASGFPEYNVWPSGERDDYPAIVFLEPFSGRNLRAFGYDMFSKPTRRAVMERACDSATPAVSLRITLVQETSKDVQRGLLIYLPVYRGAVLPHSLEERRAALLGYVYSPFRVHDLIAVIPGLAMNINF